MSGFLLFLLGFGVCLAKKPNIIFILSDDLGYDDLYYQSHQIRTPNIDKFVAEGQFLEWHYAQSICSPSRAALMTGRYPLHTGINDWIQPHQTFGVPLNNTMLPKILYNNGYDTHMVGKWHLGMFKWKYTPTYRGYTSFYGYYTGGEDYYSHKNHDHYDFRKDIGIECGPNCSVVEVSAYQQYSTPLFSQRAVEIIANHSTHTDTKDKPLFLYLAYQAVHSSNNGSAPGECPPQWIEPYNNEINDTKRKLFAGMISCMDEGIGNITQALDKYGYLNADGNTIIIMSSDNGGPTSTGDGIGSSNYPLRGGKHSIWEGGTRVTAWLWATNDIISQSMSNIGSNYTQLMHLVDWMPTILEAAGINHTFAAGLEVDGVSHWKGLSYGNLYKDPYFHFRDNIYYGYDDNSNPKNVGYRYLWYKIFNSSGGNPSAWSPKNNAPNINAESLNDIWHIDNDGGSHMHIMSGDYVLESRSANVPLYNLSNDYAERYDIASYEPDLVNQIVQKMHALQATGVPQASNDENCPPISYPPYAVVGDAWQPWCG